MTDMWSLAEAMSAAITARINGESVEIALARFGFDNENDYFRALFAVPMPVAIFQYVMASYFQYDHAYERKLAGAMRQADESGVAWIFIQDHDRKPILRPGEAIGWLLSRPRHARLVPPEIKAFVNGGGIFASNRERPPSPEAKLNEYMRQN
jgi:hypothetical protein